MQIKEQLIFLIVLSETIKLMNYTDRLVNAKIEFCQ